MTLRISPNVTMTLFIHLGGMDDSDHVGLRGGDKSPRNKYSFSSSTAASRMRL